MPVPLPFAAGTPGLEDNEIEFLEPGAQYQVNYQSRFDSFELNIGSSRTVRPVFFALGWRHMELKESAAVLARGNFQTMDADDGALPGSGTDEPNNQLSNAALIAAGFTNTGGAADGFSGYDPTAVNPLITQLGVAYRGTAYNDLDALAKFARGVTVVTFEFENVSVDAVNAIERTTPVRPGAEVLFMSQHRSRE